jgi:hypothetical protein
VVHSAMKSPTLDRTSRYSGRYRPAWRISQIGGGQTGSPRSAHSSGFTSVFMPFE